MCLSHVAVLRLQIVGGLILSHPLSIISELAQVLKRNLGPIEGLLVLVDLLRIDGLFHVFFLLGLVTVLREDLGDFLLVVVHCIVRGI